MKFFLGKSSELDNIERKNIIIIKHSIWNDWWRYEILYMLTYYNEDSEEISLGTVKIGQKEMSSNQKQPDLPLSFVHLSDDFFSLGQDISYYRTLNKLGRNFRDEILNALNDVAFDNELFNRIFDLNVTKIALLRSVSSKSVTGEFHRLSHGNPKLTEYSFKFIAPTSSQEINSPVILDFEVTPESNPPTNIHVIIGRNGVGKTHLFNNMIETLLSSNSKKKTKGWFSDSELNPIVPFSNIISVSFSAFDGTTPVQEERDKSKRINYSYIGLKRFNTKLKKVESMSPTVLCNEFIRSVEICKLQGKHNRWKNALQGLETDPVFKDAEVSIIVDIDDKESIKSIFNRLSSGHKVVLLTVTSLLEKLEEKSLILLDEPEGHLHPPLLSSFIRVLSKMLIERNAVAIIGTHSPVILQEVPSKATWILRRHRLQTVADRPEIETFGENVGTLTQEVFGLEVAHSGFHNILEEASKRYSRYIDASNAMNNQLGQEAKAILRSLIRRNEKNK